MKFRKLQTKILAGYIIIVLIFAIISGISYIELKDVGKDLSQLTKVEFTFYKINQNLAFNVAQKASLGRAYMLYGKSEYVQDFDRLTQEAERLEQQLLSMSDTQEHRDLITRTNAWNKAMKEELFVAVERGNAQEINAIGAKIAPETQALVQFNSDMAAKREKNIELINKEVTQKQDLIIVILVVSTLIAIALALFLGTLSARSITKPIIKLANVSEKIAQGDLDVTVDVSGEDEIGALSKAFHTMTNNLNDVMSNISSSAEQVAVGSKQVSDSSMALSQGATEQASSIEQLTASIEEISSQTKQNADNANQANAIAETAKANAAKGNEQMKQMLDAMDEINDSSSKISKIIKVIDEIAFQTNILALNAAVEAARAGQHGKGFAVVAEEVRNLAARSANAAKETTEMIESSIRKVDGGTRIANETANALSSIVDGVARVANLVSEIAGASNEQAAGITQINQGIMQVSQVVQTNSATSEESAAASEELSSQADLLREQVARFKLRKIGRSGSGRGLDDINPEVLKLLEQMNSNKMSTRRDSQTEAAPARKIALSDSEFGKY